MTSAVSSIARLVFIGAVLLASWLPSPAAAQAPVAPSLAVGDPTDRVRILVRLAVPVQPEGVISLQAVAQQRAAIAAAQASGRALLLGIGGTPVGFATLPWVAAEVTRSQIDAIVLHPLVAAVDEDVIVRTSLAESVPRVGAPAVWAAGYRGTGWTVAVLDTGVDTAHPFLAGAIVREACFSTGGASSSSLCPGGVSSSVGPGASAACPAGVAGCEHGTHVAGIAVGRDNTQGLYGVARDASLLPIQVFSRFEDPGLCAPLYSPCALAYMSDVARALDYVMEQAGAGNANRVAAVNLSLAGTTYASACDAAPGMQVVKAGIDHLRSIGIPTVIAAGNQGANGAIGAPACISTAVSVGSTEDYTDSLSTFSNHSTQLQLVAPGSIILSSLPGGDYGFMAGTSMAAPHVAGAWALIKQVRPSASVSSVLDALRGTGAAVAGTASGESFTRIRIDSAIDSLAPSAPPTAPLGLAATVSGATITATWQAPTSGAVSTYIVQAGSAPGASDFFNGAVGFTQSVAATVPPGVYYIRVRAQNAAGTSTVSNEAIATVAGTPTAPPGAPQGVAATVSVSTITLRWQPPTTGGVASTYIVQAGSTAGAADFFNGPVGNITAVQAVVPTGTYYIRVVAQNAMGLSVPSAEVTAVVTGGCTLPVAPTLQGAASGESTATVAWTTPSGGPITGYVLQAGSAPGGSDFYNGPVGNINGLTATVGPGTYHVRVFATSSCGVGAPSNEVPIVVP